jgi:hypothetical protein
MRSLTLPSDLRPRSPRRPETISEDPFCLAASTISLVAWPSGLERSASLPVASASSVSWASRVDWSTSCLPSVTVTTSTLEPKAAARRAAARTGPQEPEEPSLATRILFGNGSDPGASRAISSGRSVPCAASLAVLPKRIP